MKRLKYLNWSDGAKIFKEKGSAVCLKAKNSLFARLLLIAKSSRSINLEHIISQHEFSPTSAALMKADGSLHPCHDKAKLTIALEEMAPNNESSRNRSCPVPGVIIFDGMAVVHESCALQSRIHTCKDLADVFTSLIRTRSEDYSEVYIMFDDYSKKDSVKDQTRLLRTAGQAHYPGHKVDDVTKVKDIKKFLSSKQTKLHLVPYLAQKVVQSCSKPVTVQTPKAVVTSETADALNLNCSHEEADTLLVLYGAELYKAGKVVHIYSSDTDVLVLCLRRAEELGPDAAMIMGTGEKRRCILVKPLFDCLGPNKSAALPGFHAITGCDTTGHIQGKSKATCFKTFLDTSEDVVTALQNLGLGSIPSDDVLRGGEKFLCQLYNRNTSQASELRWQAFRQLSNNKGIEKLPPTQGAIVQHILRAHYHANI